MVLLLVLGMVCLVLPGSPAQAEAGDPNPGLGSYIPLADLRMPAPAPDSSCEWYGSIVKEYQSQNWFAEDPDVTTLTHETHQSAFVSAPQSGVKCAMAWAGRFERHTKLVEAEGPGTCGSDRIVHDDHVGAGDGNAGRLVVDYLEWGDHTTTTVKAFTDSGFSVTQTQEVIGGCDNGAHSSDPYASDPSIQCAIRNVPQTAQVIVAICDPSADDFISPGGSETHARSRYVIRVRRTVCDTRVDTDRGGVSDCAEFSAGTDPSSPGDDSPKDECPQVPPAGPGLRATAVDRIGDPTVRFTLSDSAINAAGFAYALGFGDGTSASIVPGHWTEHTYASAGQYEATVVMTYPWGDRTCVGDPVTFPVAADPATTYAPSVHMHPDDRWFPDSVTPFLGAAALVHDLPNAGAGSDYLSSKACPDKVLAVGAQVELRRLRSARGPTTRVGHSEPRLDPARLGRRSNAYSARESRSTLGACHKLKARYDAHDKGAAKAGNHNSKDDGLVLSLAGAAKSVLKGDHSLNRAKIYVDLVPGRFVTYWLFYPNNEWRHARTGKLTERHEGDWEHITVRLSGQSGRMTQVAYYQHYCAAKKYGAGELKLESSTHPPVWSALGGHASYHKNVGRKSAGSCQLLQGNTDRTAAGGKVWRTWQKTGTGASRLAEATTQPWYGFKGAWGDPRPAFLANYGPKAPGGQDGDLPSGW